ncbi:MAG: FKBP-type peptidyl-prolyl cis-trans isomerase [Bacteroidota bacterium]
MHTFRTILFFLAVFGLLSCNGKRENESKSILNQAQINEKLVGANIASVKFENEQINKLISGYGWKMTETATGLRYQFIEKGNGAKAETEKVAVLEYEVRLFSGELIYSSKQTGFKEFRIGSGGVESGLEEGILLLKIGDKVRFVIPSYLAHGLSGDQDKIPPKATLIYTVKLIDLK